jgi:hypothetical protein
MSYKPARPHLYIHARLRAAIPLSLHLSVVMDSAMLTYHNKPHANLTLPSTASVSYTLPILLAGCTLLHPTALHPISFFPVVVPRC